MMLIFQKQCRRSVGGGLKIRTHADKGIGGKKWAKICERPLWMAPNINASDENDF